VYEPPPSEYEGCKDPIKVVDDRSLEALDPTGARTKLFDKKNPDRAKPGDILLATFKTGEPFSGILMAVKGQGPHKSVLLRNQLTRIGTEMLIKIHSPLVQSMEVAQRDTKRRRRARLYYLRKPKHDVGSVQKVVDQYVRERAILSGKKNRSSSTRSNSTPGKK
jgi:large subunit ribosomal protein L19